MTKKRMKELGLTFDNFRVESRLKGEPTWITASHEKHIAEARGAKDLAYDDLVTDGFDDPAVRIVQLMFEVIEE